MNNGNQISHDQRNTDNISTYVDTPDGRSFAAISPATAAVRHIYSKSWRGTVTQVNKLPMKTVAKDSFGEMA